MKITVAGIEFDLNKALPLKVKDWKALEAQGVGLRQVSMAGEVTVDNLSKLAQVVLKKARPEISDDFVDELTLEDLVQIAKAVPQSESEAMNRPT